MIELLASLDRNVAVGIAQAAAAIALCLCVVAVCRRFSVHVERETVVSLARGLVQIGASAQVVPGHRLLELSRLDDILFSGDWWERIEAQGKRGVRAYY